MLRSAYELAVQRYIQAPPDPDMESWGPQERCSEIIRQGLVRGRNVVVESGCGTGKTEAVARAIKGAVVGGPSSSSNIIPPRSKLSSSSNMSSSSSAASSSSGQDGTGGNVQEKICPGQRKTSGNRENDERLPNLHATIATKQINQMDNIATAMRRHQIPYGFVVSRRDACCNTEVKTAAQKEAKENPDISYDEALQGLCDSSCKFWKSSVAKESISHKDAMSHKDGQCPWRCAFLRNKQMVAKSNVSAKLCTHAYLGVSSSHGAKSQQKYLILDEAHGYSGTCGELIQDGGGAIPGDAYRSVIAVSGTVFPHFPGLFNCIRKLSLANPILHRDKHYQPLFVFVGGRVDASSQSLPSVAQDVVTRSLSAMQLAHLDRGMSALICCPTGRVAEFVAKNWNPSDDVEVMSATKEDMLSVRRKVASLPEQAFLVVCTAASGGLCEGI